MDTCAVLSLEANASGHFLARFRSTNPAQYKCGPGHADLCNKELNEAVRQVKEEWPHVACQPPQFRCKEAEIETCKEGIRNLLAEQGREEGTTDSVIKCFQKR
jgi:hypothetical protein